MKKSSRLLLPALIIALLCSCGKSGEKDYADNTYYGCPIAIWENYAYISEFSGGDIIRFDMNTGESEMFLTGCQASALMTIGGYLYFVDTGDLKRVSISGGEPESVYKSKTGVCPLLLTYKDDVYFATEDNCFYKLLRDGEVRLISSDVSTISNCWIAYTGGRLYYRSAEDESVMSMQPDGSDNRKVTNSLISFTASTEDGLYYQDYEGDSIVHKYMAHDGTTSETGHWVLHSKSGSTYYVNRQSATDTWLVRNDGGIETKLWQVWSYQAIYPWKPPGNTPEFLFAEGWIFRWAYIDGHVTLSALNEETLEEITVWVTDISGLS